MHAGLDYFCDDSPRAPQRAMVGTSMRGWSTQQQDDRRALRWLLVSIAIHLPFTPLGPLFGLLAFLSRPEQPPAPIEELHGIPVELLQPDQPSKEPNFDDEPSVTMPPMPDFPDFTPKRRKHIEEEPVESDAATPEDAGTRDTPIAALDASTPNTAVAMAGDAGVDAGTAVAQGAAPNAEEALAAATHGIADSNANVRLNLFMDRVRQQPLGEMLGHLLKSVYQWRDFFAPGGLDPVKDFDQILLFGPQLRDSSQVAAFLQHNVRAPRMRGAIDGLVKKSGPESVWLKGTKYPAARAFADRSQRSFVMYPGKVVAVVPPRVEKDALALSNFKLPSASGDELASVFVKTPWRALLGTGFQLSKSIRSATIKVFPDEDGGARIEAALDDESSEAAQRDVKQIKHDVDTVTLASNWLLSGSRLAEPLQTSTDGGKIHLVLRFSRAQAERIFALAEGMLTPEGRSAARAARNLALADAGVRVPQTPSVVPSAAKPEPAELPSVTPPVKREPAVTPSVTPPASIAP